MKGQDSLDRHVHDGHAGRPHDDPRDALWVGSRDERLPSLEQCVDIFNFARMLHT